MAPASHRGFLRDLARLPLIGGSVALIGSPTQAAAPLTPGMMSTYLAWLEMEARLIRWGCGGMNGVTSHLNPGWRFHCADGFLRRGQINEAMRRAPIVLSAVGCPLTDEEAELESAWMTTSCPQLDTSGVLRR